MEFDDLSNQVIGAALRVHSPLGHDLFDEVHKVCLRHEPRKAGIKVKSEVPVPAIFRPLLLFYHSDCAQISRSLQRVAARGV